MIDVGQLEERLDRALEEDLREHLGLDDRPATWATTSSPATGSAVAGPTVAKRSRSRRRRPERPHQPETPRSIDDHARRVVELVQLGRMVEADDEISVHARLAERTGGALARRDAAAWATMRALLDGREHDARVGNDAVLSLGESGGDSRAWNLHWAQRFWVVQEWGSERETNELLDICRQRAYWHNEIDWRAALALALSRTDYAEEAWREFDFVILTGRDRTPRDAAWLDIVTNLAETAAALRDPARAGIVYDLLQPFADSIAVVGPAFVCKGSVSHQLGLLADILGRGAEADRHFRAAAAAHRRIGGGSLLARTRAASERLRSA